MARASHLQSRLTSAMDAMETLRLQHRQEMAEERQARERLKVKMERLIEFTAHVEAERDDTREGILAVLDRGMCSALTVCVLKVEQGEKGCFLHYAF